MHNIKQKIEGIHDYDFLIFNKSAWVIELDRKRNADTFYKSHMNRYTSKKSSFFPEIDQIYPGTGRLHDKRHDHYLHRASHQKCFNTYIVIYKT